jgi:hypothetical protein
MRKTTLASILMLAASSCISGFAQQQKSSSRSKENSGPPVPQCILKISESPEFRGLKLGLDRGTAQIPGMLTPRPDKYVINSETVKEDYLKRGWPNRFQGVSGLYVKLFDDRLVAFTIFYDDSVQWPSLDEFIVKLPNLPNAWVKWKGDRLLKYMKCDGFIIAAAIVGGSGQVVLEDSTLEERLQKRIAEVDKRERATFKP